MELAFTILASIGALLIVLGYLGFVFAGFRHHFVTGIISTLPVLNIVTVPALWSKAKGKVITSFIGIIIFVASWFLGANTGIQKFLGILKESSQPAQTSIESPATNTNNASSSTFKTPITENEKDRQALPKKALYRMKFEVIPVDEIQSLQDKIVRIVTTNNNQIEGRITSISSSSIIIQNNELPIANIKQLSLMVKNSN